MCLLSVIVSVGTCIMSVTCRKGSVTMSQTVGSEAIGDQCSNSMKEIKHRESRNFRSCIFLGLELCPSIVRFRPHFFFILQHPIGQKVLCVWHVLEKCLVPVSAPPDLQAFASACTWATSLCLESSDSWQTIRMKLRVCHNIDVRREMLPFHHVPHFSFFSTLSS